MRELPRRGVNNININSTALLLLIVVIMAFGMAVVSPDGEPVFIKGEYYGATTTALDLSGMELNDNDIAPLKDMANLTELNLKGNQISDLSPLSGLADLTGLDLDENNISDLSQLSGLTNLRYLYLSKNQISDLEPLSSLMNLEELHLDGNQISDWSPVEHVPKVAGRPPDNSFKFKIKTGHINAGTFFI